MLNIGKDILSGAMPSRPLSFNKPVPESNEFKQCLKNPKNWFQLSAGLNLETLNTILSGTNHI